MIEFSVPGKAEPAGSKRAFMRPGMKFPVVTDDNPKVKGWKKDIKSYAAEAMVGRELLDGPIAVTLRFVMVRPKSHYGKKGLRPSAPRYPTVRPDVLKLGRAVEDALTQVVYKDDAQIVSEYLEKEYGERHGNVGVEVEVEQLK